MKTALVLLLAQGALGAFDTLWFHEWKGRLPGRPGAALELRLHAARDFIYAVIFGSLGWVAWQGAWAWILMALLAVEIGITLWDFIEEDRVRPLSPGERATHALMGIVYGAFLACLMPEVLRWIEQATLFAENRAGVLGWVLSSMAVGVFLSGVRDLRASLGPPSPPSSTNQSPSVGRGH